MKGAAKQRPQHSGIGETWKDGKRLRLTCAYYKRGEKLNSDVRASSCAPTGRTAQQLSTPRRTSNAARTGAPACEDIGHAFWEERRTQRGSHSLYGEPTSNGAPAQITSRTLLSPVPDRPSDRLNLSLSALGPPLLSSPLLQACGTRRLTSTKRASESRIHRRAARVHDMHRASPSKSAAAPTAESRRRARRLPGRTRALEASRRSSCEAGDRRQAEPSRSGLLTWRQMQYLDAESGSVGAGVLEQGRLVGSSGPALGTLPAGSALEALKDRTIG